MTNPATQNNQEGISLLPFIDNLRVGEYQKITFNNKMYLITRIEDEK